jgi:small subunit ribosomal protein S17e
MTTAGLFADKSQFDSIPTNVIAVSQQQVVERPRRFNDRPART